VNLLVSKCNNKHSPSLSYSFILFISLIYIDPNSLIYTSLLFKVTHFFLLIQTHTTHQFTMSFLPRPSRRPYSMVLSALYKMELIHLSLEFRLPTDGSVVTLWNHLRCYLNFNQNMLVQNPEFSALFPRHRQANHFPSPPLSSNTLRLFPPTISYHDSSLAHFYTSWNSIEDQPQGHLSP
jgi:hypothetical protein